MKPSIWRMSLTLCSSVGVLSSIGVQSCARIGSKRSRRSKLRNRRTFITKRARALNGVAFMFPGQGAQYVNMGRELYETEPLFRREVDESCEELAPLLGLNLRTVLFPGPDCTTTAQRALTQTAVTQPALFVIEHALARLWISWGVRPVAMIGHSIGEYVAACVGGTLDRDSASASFGTPRQHDAIPSLRFDACYQGFGRAANGISVPRDLYRCIQRSQSGGRVRRA